MAQLPNLTETIDLGSATAEAYAKINTNFQKLSPMSCAPVVFALPGIAYDGTVFGKTIRDKYQLLIYEVELRIDTNAPSGGDLTVKLVVGGAAMAQTYTLTAGSQYVLVAVVGDGNGGSGSGLVVAAGTSVEAKIINGNNATDVVVRAHAQERVL